ncbi:MAG: hypothetical protein AAFV51_08085, partial [Pseudomonadota bacterium]
MVEDGARRAVLDGEPGFKYLKGGALCTRSDKNAVRRFVGDARSGLLFVGEAEAAAGRPCIDKGSEDVPTAVAFRRVDRPQSRTIPCKLRRRRYRLR